MNTRKVTQCFTFIWEIYTSVKRKTFVGCLKHIKKASEQKFYTKTFFHKTFTKKEKGFMIALLKCALLFILNFPDRILAKIWCLLKKKKKNGKVLHTSELVLQVLLEPLTLLLTH